MSKLEYTPLDEITRVRDYIVCRAAEPKSKSVKQIHESLSASFKAGKMQSIAFRKRQLARIAYMIKVCVFEGLFLEIGYLCERNYLRKI
jgi:hypothetical protein